MTDNDAAVQIALGVLRGYSRSTAHDVSVVRNTVAALRERYEFVDPAEVAALRAAADAARALGTYGHLVRPHEGNEHRALVVALAAVDALPPADGTSTLPYGQNEDECMNITHTGRPCGPHCMFVEHGTTGGAR